MNTLTITVFNRILSMFNLEIMEGRLFYKYELHYGSIDFFISDLKDEYEINKLTNLLQLPYVPWGDDAEELYYCLINSPYFNKTLFLNYHTRLKNYGLFKDLIIKNLPMNFHSTFISDSYSRILIDKWFNTTINSKVNSLIEQQINKTFIKNNFNGHLVLKWVPNLKPGKLLSETILEFKEHIQKRFKTNFLEYLINRVPSTIRLDFLFYYYKDFDFFEQEYTNELPF